MWVISNQTPYAAERNWVRDKRGEHHWIVAVRATYDILPEGVKLAEEQLPPALAPEYFGEPGKSSLRWDADLSAKKLSTDIIVNAHAHAPRGKPATSVQVSLRVGSVHKTLIVHGPRVYGHGFGVVATSSPKPFSSEPIRYESAFGGMDQSDPDARRHVVDARNPVGRGVASDKSRLEGRLTHAIEHITGDPRTRGPAGYGAIDSWWAPRSQLAGTYDEHWAKTQKPFLPADYDEAFTLSSPVDQRPKDHLKGGERVELVHMTPEGVLNFELPNVALRFATWFGSRREDHFANLSSVIIEPEEKRVIIVWQTSLHVKARDCDYLDRTSIWEEST